MEATPRHQQAYGPERNNRTISDSVKLKCVVLGGSGAGKTSLLRRYFFDKFHPGNRIPTNGSDYYTKKMRNPMQKFASNSDCTEWKIDGRECVNGSGSVKESSPMNPQEQVEPAIAERISSQQWITLQVWDTAGRERHDAKFTASLSDAFFRHADAAMLVYDATSSSSFFSLLRWYAELMERRKSIILDEQESMNENPSVATNSKPFPVLIVANKMDIIEQRIKRPQRRREVPQRDVMGLKGKFKGKDSRYEYRVSPPSDNTWTTDFSYLHSVQKTEDGSFPDREMTVLWCLRNRLKHYEVSALTGSGVNEAMDALVKLAMESLNERFLVHEREEIEMTKASSSILTTTTASFFTLDPPFQFRKNKELNLHQRYAPKKERCFEHPFVFGICQS